MMINPSSGNIISFDDTIPPITTCSLDPPEPNGDNGWYVSDVEVTLNATDDLSGVNRIEYRIQDGNWQTIPGNNGTFIINEDGDDLLIEYYAIDNAGNEETHHIFTIDIDQTVPSIVEIIYEKIGKNKGKMTVVCTDDTSEINRTEFLLDFELWFTDFKDPYEWIVEGYGPGHFYHCEVYDDAGNMEQPGIGIPPHDNKLKGIILYPQIANKTITFFTIFAFSRGLGYPWMGIHIFQWLTYRNDFTGYIGKYWIDGVFHHT